MLARIRSFSLAGGGALALTVTLSGVVAAATVIAVIAAPTPAAPAPDAAPSFVDLDGNGVDDRCQTAVVADPVAAASAEIAADLNADGTISVTEAAHSGRVGGTNCNHGGYVSIVAHGTGTCAAPETADSSTAPDPEAETSDASTEPIDANDVADSSCAETAASAEPDETDKATKDETPAVCVAPVVTAPAAPVVSVIVDPAPNAHGKAVSLVAQSDAVGGKNCNHGGAVSAAAKKDHEAAKNARDLAKAARDAARLARTAAHAAKHHGKPAG
jgi:hypothetical protein